MVQTRSRSPLFIGLLIGLACMGVLLLVVLALVIGLVVWNGSSSDSSPEQGSAPSAAPSAGADGTVLPPGVAEDQPYLEVGTSADGPVLDVYVDFLCPHCATFHDAQGEDLARMAEDGEITLRVHPRPMLDASSTPEGYSGRAANAAVCAYAEDPAQWFAAESALFEYQPDAAGLSDEELTALVTDATGLEVGDCISEGTYLPWIEDVVEPEARASTDGTPVVFLDGEKFTGELTAPGSLEEAVAAA